MNLTPGVTINSEDAVTRQTIYDLVANAVGGIVQASDLHSSVQTISTGSDAPTAYPGKVWFDEVENLFKVYVDEIDGTGCSLWLAFGPDRFDIPMIASEPIPFGAAVQLAGNARYAKLPPGPLELVNLGYPAADAEAWKVVGFQNIGVAESHTTAASGSWFNCAVEGVVWTWHPLNKNLGGAHAGGFANSGGLRFDSLCSGITLTTGPSGYTAVAGGLTKGGYVAQTANVAGVGLVVGMESIDAFHRNWKRSIFFGARRGRD